ncbi:MAG: hypothetical protein KDB35_08005 [Acidimicrobiales bacterium]|nr:hypothetical protein [Acidimicrobiales bacterium]
MADEAARAAAHGAPDRWRRLAPFLGVVGVGVLLLAFSSPWLAAGFGETHDGRNGSVWGTVSRSIREDGVVASKFGGAPRHNDAYANHPPLIVAETVVAELVAGEHRIVTRSPAWVGSLVALALVAWLLVDAGLSRLATVSGVAVAFGSAMFLVYGSMLDTPVTSVPFALALLVAWQRARQDRPWHPAVLGGLSALAVLAGWQSTALLVACGAVSVIGTVRRRFPTAQLVAMAVGGACGLAVALSWVAWVYGSLRPLFDTAGDRRTSLSLADSLSTQLAYLMDLAPWALAVGVPGIVAALWRPATRPLAAVTATTVVGYGVVFSEAAEIHDYWSFGVVVPLAIGVAALVQLLIDRTPAPQRRSAVLLAVALPAIGLVPTLLRPSDAEEHLRFGLRTPQITAAAARLAPRDGPALAYLEGAVREDTWIRYETGRPAQVLVDRGALRDLAVADPAFPVLVLVDADTKADLRSAAIATAGPYAVVTASDADRIVRWPR